MQTKIDRVAQHKELATNSFKDHVIEQQLDSDMFRHWRCAKPGCGNYAFNVTTIPGRLIVTGDIGTLVVERERDMIAWGRKSIRDIYYFGSKVPHEIEIKEWDSELVPEWLDEKITEATNDGNQKRVDQLRSLVGMDDDYSEWRFPAALYDSGVVDDIPAFQSYKSSYLWCREALLWFFANLKGGE